MSKPILLKNIKTGESFAFSTITECALFLKSPRPYISKLIKENKTYKNTYKFFLKQDLIKET